VTTSTARTTLRTIAGATLVWSVLCAVILMPIWSLMSKTRLTWALFVAFAPPLYALGQYVAGSLTSGRAGQAPAARSAATVLPLAAGIVALIVSYALAVLIATQFA
jgi:hypothetical protein